MIINENGHGNDVVEVKESVKAKKIKKQSEEASAEVAGEEDAEQE